MGSKLAHIEDIILLKLIDIETFWSQGNNLTFLFIRQKVERRCFCPQYGIWLNE